MGELCCYGGSPSGCLKPPQIWFRFPPPSGGGGFRGLFRLAQAMGLFPVSNLRGRKGGGRKKAKKKRRTSRGGGGGEEEEEEGEGDSGGEVEFKPVSLRLLLSVVCIFVLLIVEGRRSKLQTTNSNYDLKIHCPIFTSGFSLIYIFAYGGGRASSSSSSSSPLQHVSHEGFAASASAASAVDYHYYYDESEDGKDDHDHRGGGRALYSSFVTDLAPVVYYGATVRGRRRTSLQGLNFNRPSLLNLQLYCAVSLVLMARR